MIYSELLKMLHVLSSTASVVEMLRVHHGRADTKRHDQSNPSLNSIYSCARNVYNGAIRSEEHMNVCKKKLKQIAMNVIEDRNGTQGIYCSTWGKGCQDL